MTSEQLDAVQARLEAASTIAQNLSVKVGGIRNKMYGAGRGQFSQDNINIDKSDVKTDIAALIKDLQATQNLIH